jgi:hypothetical protein
MNIQLGMQEVLPWLGPAFDLTLAAMLGLVLWRLHRDAERDPAAVWREREVTLREIFAGLQALVAEADRQARELDERLAAHAAGLRELVAEEAAERQSRELRRVGPMEPAVPASAADDEEAAAAALGARIAELAEAGTPVQEIARTLDVPVAEVRLVMALGEAVRERAPRSAAPPTRPAGSAGKNLPSGTSRAGAKPTRLAAGGAGQGQFYGTSIA